ncbi:MULTISPECIES: glutaredoxin family protein [Auritidibacter]|uniref:Glutaredoxin family protein n=1 Tax=Auritidibacter ignavus TaxID=678932 RepID=A0AAJ6DC30_9MICC|nr:MULTISPECIES: glutaredoxin family protein [Auritidibacter]PXA78053.1 NrdH-redoxin [Auritidibacter sp. NML120779]AXR74908.1 glutaredoxin family protein [Auritidibacter sp. NML130574]NIH71333.1 thiol-disulfide isomerase/thioredoxin [Auritidibacter ignavus]PXA78251.1 NrdH-redoxin [Auritidibacter sp. NML100628]PXA81016.1 NrdH-redoxin [Auritidibacter sp. NML120636]
MSTDDCAPDTPPPVLQVLVKSGCHLCEEAIATAEQIAEEFHVDCGVIDASLRPDLAERFVEEIPVLFVDGLQRDFWRIDTVRLRALLSARRPSSDRPSIEAE